MSNRYSGEIQSFWKNVPEGLKKPQNTAYLMCAGLLIGIVVGCVISFFRVSKNWVSHDVVQWVGAHLDSFWSMFAWIVVALAAGLIVCQLVRNPAIRLGGEDWIKSALAGGQMHTWFRTLYQKFLGIWLVLVCGISVGSEDPSIQMGAASALGLKKIYLQSIERRYFILGGCAAGLSAAFSAPFAGICYLWEVMGEELSFPLFIYMLAGGIGVYFATTFVFDLGVMLPLHIPTATLSHLWLLPLGILSSLIGIVYYYLIVWLLHGYEKQKLIPEHFLPMLAFAGAAIMVMVYPIASGEGMDIFPLLEEGNFLVSSLCTFLLVKILFTAFCYGTGIPAGKMVPVLCIGGVTGAIYAHIMIGFGLFAPEMLHPCIAVGMCATFAAAERAPVTGIVLVSQMIGSITIMPIMLACAAIATFIARICHVK